MNRIFRRSLLQWITCGSLFTSIAGHCDSNPEADQRINQRIDRLETDMRKIRTENAYGNFGPRTATANPQVDGYGFVASADFLWWKLYQGSTDYLVKAKNDRTVLPVEGHLKHFNFRWEPGFKVGLGYVFDHDGWDADAEFTFFQTQAHSHASASQPHLFPLVGNPALNYTKAHGIWNVKFYDLNVVLGRNYFVSKYLALRPFFGLATAWIDQQRRFHFVESNGDLIYLRNRNDFWGIGPRIGLDAQFAFCESFSFYGNVAGNLMWGEFRTDELDKDKTTELVFHDLHYNLHRMVSTTAFGLGFAYETSFLENTYYLMIKCGYESQYWWRQNQLPIPDVNSLLFRRASNDLSLQGLTLEFKLDF